MSVSSKPGDPFYWSPAWLKTRQQVLTRDGPRCCMCGTRSQRRWHVDHIIPRKKAPELALDTRNLQTLCERCHNSAKRYHELNQPVEHGLDGFPKGGGWS